jgi:hypothetical protein
MLDLEDELRALLHEHSADAPASPDLAARIDRRLHSTVRTRRIVAAALTAAVVAGAALTTGVLVGRHHDNSVRTTATPGPTTTVRAAVQVQSGQWATIAEPPMTGAYASVWTGTELVVAFRAPDLLRFAAYDPQHDQWHGLPDPPVEIQAPLSDSPTFAWTGSTLLVWGYENHDAGDTSGGEHRLLALDPATGRWRRLADPPIHSLIEAEPIWTGHDLIVWGGSYGDSAPAQGAAYDPASNQWHPIAAAPISIRSDPTVVWTGSEMIVFGGATADSEGRQPLTAADRLEGAAYNPATDSWRPLAASGLPAMELAAAAWTGREMIVFGDNATGPSGRDVGAAYNPTTNTWRSIATTPLSQREQMSSTWTGHELVIWGGISFEGFRHTLADGAAYNPTTNTWRMLAASPLGPRWGATASTTGDGLVIVVGGNGPSSAASSGEPVATGAAAYRP